MQRHVYLVNWLGGTSGAFITALLNQFIHEPLPDDQIIFSQYGDSHQLSDCYQENLSFDRTKEHNAHETPVYEYMKPKFASLPFTMIDHTVPVYSRLFDRYPTCKNIVITVSDDMWMRVRGNMFFKNTCQGFPGNREYWDEQRLYHKCIKDFEDPNDVDNDSAELYIKEVCRSPFPVREFYHEKFPVPENYKDNIIRVSFRDIIHNPDVVLNQLNEVTGNSILPGHVHFYQRYIDKQNELVKTRMPWLNDK